MLCYYFPRHYNQTEQTGDRERTGEWLLLKLTFFERRPFVIIFKVINLFKNYDENKKSESGV